MVLLTYQKIRKPGNDGLEREKGKIKYEKMSKLSP